MNLAQAGIHEAADWLLIKLRSYDRPVAVFMRDDDGQLFAGRADQAKAPPRSRPVGVYRKGLRYREAVEDLTDLLLDYRGANDDA